VGAAKNLHGSKESLKERKRSMRYIKTHHLKAAAHLVKTLNRLENFLIMKATRKILIEVKAKRKSTIKRKERFIRRKAAIKK
jgi:hypothetical protein